MNAEQAGWRWRSTVCDPVGGLGVLTAVTAILVAAALAAFRQRGVPQG